MAQYRIVRVPKTGDAPSVNITPMDEELAGRKWLALLERAADRRSLQWAGLFRLGDAATDEWVCIAQHTRPTA